MRPSAVSPTSRALPDGIRRRLALRARTRSPERLEWVDVARGIAIILMVIGHVVAGTHAAGILADAAHSYTYSFLYGFHMPLFFVLSGLFVDASIRRSRGAGRFLQGKVLSVVYPYFLWSTLQAFVNFALAPLTNTAPRPWRLVAITYAPIKQYWFLYALFLCFALYVLIAPVRRRPHALLALAMFAVQPFLPITLSIVRKFMAHYVFFTGGAFLRGWIVTGVARATWRVVVALLAGFLAAEAIYLWLEVTPTVHREHIALTPWYFPVPVLGISFVLALSGQIARADALPLLSYVGERSFPIFLTHLIATAGTRIVLHKLGGIDNVAVHLVLGTLAGVVFPLVLYEITRRFGLTRVAGFGTT